MACTVTDTTITNSAVSKTEVREVAENSIRSTFSYAVTIAATHYDVGELQSGRSPVSKATEGAQLFERLVSEANEGLPVRPIFPQFLASTDDSGLYYVIGINDKRANVSVWRFARRRDGENTGVRATYKTTKKSMLFGQRCRLSWTASADGTLAPAYVSFLGLSERELPTATCPSGILVIPIEGLAVGGVNPDFKSIGYIVLVRQGENMEYENFYVLS